MDRLRVKNEKLSDLEQEQKLKNDALQRKAMMQLQENEEEIKRLNQVRNDTTTFATFTETSCATKCSGLSVVRSRTGRNSRRSLDALRKYVFQALLALIIGISKPSCQSAAVYH